jgi:nicotinamide riboside kinase
MSDLESIAAEQVRRDREMAAHAQRVLVADTSPLTTLTYARYYHGTVSALLEHIAASYHARDHFVVLCDTDIPFDDSWDRSGPGSREQLQDITREELRRRGLQYVLASGPTESRVTTILTSLTEWRYRC